MLPDEFYISCKNWPFNKIREHAAAASEALQAAMPDQLEVARTESEGNADIILGTTATYLRTGGKFTLFYMSMDPTAHRMIDIRKVADIAEHLAALPNPT